MDLLLTTDGDLHDQTVLISGWQQSLQSVIIRIHRFKGEWILDNEAGLDYLGWKDRKRGNLIAEIKDRVGSEILRVKGVVSVDNLRIRLDPSTRDVAIQADIRLFNPQEPDVNKVVQLDTFERVIRVSP